MGNRLIILGFPLWFPLLLTGLILALVFYLLIWILVIVSYAVEASLIVASVGALVVFIASMAGGQFNLISLGISIMCAGGAALFLFVCYWATKGTLKFTKFLSINMKPVILIPIILGSALLITGGVILGLGIKNSVSSNDVVTNEFKIEEEVSKFDIDIDTANLEFKVAEGDAKVVLQEKKRLLHETSLTDGVLKITTAGQRQC